MTSAEASRVALNDLCSEISRTITGEVSTGIAWARSGCIEDELLVRIRTTVAPAMMRKAMLNPAIAMRRAGLLMHGILFNVPHEPRMFGECRSLRKWLSVLPYAIESHAVEA